VIYLLDANILITASRLYYPIDRVPEFWEWILHHARSDTVKMPHEIIGEILDGTDKDDLLLDWMKANKHDLLLNEHVDAKLMQVVINQGYAPDLKDDGIRAIGS